MPDEKNLHKYPQSKSSKMKPASPGVMGPTKKSVSENGPHLLAGKGSAYNLAKITNKFLTQDPRPGHTQKANIDKQE